MSTSIHIESSRPVAVPHTLPARTPARSRDVWERVPYLLPFVEALGLPALLLSPCGVWQHQTPAFRALLARYPGAAALTGIAAEWVRETEAFPGIRGLRSQESHAAVHSMERRICLPGLHATLHRLSLQGVVPGAAVHVVLMDVQMTGATLEDVLRERLRLSPRECVVARLLAGGESTVTIAERLGISVHTVRRHTEQIHRKLEVRSRASLIRRWHELERGLTGSLPSGA